MKTIGYLLFSIMAITLMLGGSAFAQGDNSFYFVTYFSNANTAAAPDATMRIVNDGDSGGDLFAAIYIFDDSEELTECCACQVTPDGLLSESVNKNLTADPITGIKPQRGVIKVISSQSSDPTVLSQVPGLREWSTHVQKLTSGYAMTETLAADSNLAPSEADLLSMLCSFDVLLNGHPCTCTQEDQDF
jgi:hypothetical protein